MKGDLKPTVFRSRRAGVIGVALLYLGVSLLLLPGFRHAINADGISYISIARRYLAGDWYAAVNSYWSPMYSWLLVPFLALKIDPLLAGKLLSILIGLITIPGVHVLAARFPLSGRLHLGFMLSLLPALWLFTFQTLTPDFLVVCVLIWYFSVIFSPGYLARPSAAVLAGVMGALAYISKGYGFYYIMAHLALMTVLLWFGVRAAEPRRKVLRAYLVSMVVFAVLSGGWIAMLTFKYGHITVSSPGRFNHALAAPGSRGQPPVAYRTFTPPGDAAAISTWDDPSVLAVTDWNPLASAGLMWHQCRVIAGNLRLTVGLLQEYSPLVFLILAVSVWFCVRRRLRCWRPGGEFLVVSTLLLYLAGYILLFVENRYLFVCYVLLALLGARAIRHLAAAGVVTGKWQAAVCLALFVSISVPFARQVRVLHGKEEGVAVYELSMRLARQTKLSGNIAANKNWHQTLFIAYHMGLRFFNVKGDTPEEEVLPALVRLGVNAYFVWDGTPEEQARYKGFPELTGGTIDGLRIYDLSGQRD